MAQDICVSFGRIVGTLVISKRPDCTITRCAHLLWREVSELNYLHSVSGRADLRYEMLIRAVRHRRSAGRNNPSALSRPRSSQADSGRALHGNSTFDNLLAVPVVHRYERRVFVNFQMKKIVPVPCWHNAMGAHY